MSSAATPLLTPEEYLAFERKAETKHEYHDGAILAMAGGTGPHSLLALNLGSEIRQQLESRPGFVFNSDMKVWIEEVRRFLYPDVSGLCGQPEYRDPTRDVLLNPTLVIEILSAKTEAYDRGKKRALYMSAPSISEIVLVSQEEVRLEKYTRQADGIWRFEFHAGMEAVARFESLGCAVALRDFYPGVELVPTA